MGVAAEPTNQPVLQSGSRLSGRTGLLLGVMIYTVAFQLSYRDLVVPQYDGWGAGYRILPWYLLAALYAVCILPATTAPIALRRPSQLLFYIQYFLVYIPAAFLAFYVNRPQLAIGDAVALVAWMCVGMMLLQAAYALPLVRFAAPRITPRLFWLAVATVGTLLFVYMAAVLFRNFRLVSLAEVYDVRTAMGDLIVSSRSGLVSYAQLWLGNLFLPTAFAVGVYFRRPLLCWLSLVAYLFIFGISGQKVALLAIVYLPAFYVLVERGWSSVGQRMTLALTAVLVGGYAVPLLFGPLVTTWYVALMNFRTFTIQGINLSQYYAFFAVHPTTKLSHLSGLRWFVHYPYGLDIPFTLGYFFYDAPVGNNSGMWATDAIGGFGPWAIPLISLFASGVFWILDSCAEGLDPRFVALMVAYIGATFANVSLGTTLVSGGLGMACFLLAFMPRSKGISTDPSLRKARGLLRASTSLLAQR